MNKNVHVNVLQIQSDGSAKFLFSFEAIAFNGLL